MLAGTTFPLSAVTAFAEGAEQLNPRIEWDHLWKEILIDITIIGILFMVAAVYMLVKYRARNADDVGSGPKLTKAQALAWALIPAAIFMADDFFLSAKGWTLWNIQRRVPENAMEVKVTGYQWYWEFEYDNGVTSEELVVPVGTPVALRMSSEDVLHSFGLVGYRVKEDLMPGRVTYIWFMPDEKRESSVVCTEYCGISHSEMASPVKAVSPDDYKAWMASMVKENS